MDPHQTIADAAAEAIMEPPGRRINWITITKPSTPQERVSQATIGLLDIQIEQQHFGTSAHVIRGQEALVIHYGKRPLEDVRDTVLADARRAVRAIADSLGVM